MGQESNLYASLRNATVTPGSVTHGLTAPSGFDVRVYAGWIFVGSFSKLNLIANIKKDLTDTDWLRLQTLIPVLSNSLHTVYWEIVPLPCIPHHKEFSKQAIMGHHQFYLSYSV